MIQHRLPARPPRKKRMGRMVRTQVQRPGLTQILKLEPRVVAKREMKTKTHSLLACLSYYAHFESLLWLQIQVKLSLKSAFEVMTHCMHVTGFDREVNGVSDLVLAVYIHRFDSDEVQIAVELITKASQCCIIPVPTASWVSSVCSPRQVLIISSSCPWTAQPSSSISIFEIDRPSQRSQLHSSLLALIPDVEACMLILRAPNQTMKLS